MGPALRDPGSAFQASGGGFSRLFPRPGYQDGVPGTGATRGVPDVSADANGHTGMTIAISDGTQDHDPQQRRNQRQRTDLGRADRAGRPVRRPPPGLRQPGHLPASPAAPTTTRPSTTSPRETTPCSSRPRRSPAIRRHPAGTRSPAGAAPTPRYSSRCSHATRIDLRRKTRSRRFVTTTAAAAVVDHSDPGRYLPAEGIHPRISSWPGHTCARCPADCQHPGLENRQGVPAAARPGGPAGKSRSLAGKSRPSCRYLSDDSSASPGGGRATFGRAHDQRDRAPW